jgi:hypothetical protein
MSTPTPTHGAVVPIRPAIRDGRASRPAATVEQLIATTRGCQIGESIGEWLEQPIEHRAAATHA